MTEVLNYGIMGIVIISTTIYVWCNLLNQKLKFKSLRFWFVLIGLIIVAVLNYYMVNKFIRIASITVILMLACSYLFKENLKTGVITALTSQLLIMLAETIFAIILSLILHSGSDFATTQFGTVLANLCISIIVILLIQINKIKELYKFFFTITKNIENSQLIIIMLIFIVVLNIFAMTAYYQLDYKLMLIFNVVTMVIYFVIIINSLKSKHDYRELP